ncbi:MAG: histidinol-phosphate transaminase [candidate division Zixibacteria bacterium]|nr:histidinol-phosphate transaminase [candidate division Zixibacteria bacterium]
MKIRIPDFIKSLKPYRAGKPISELAREKGLSKIVKLASNENPLGSSPLALEAVKRELADSYRYVDPRAYKLTHAIAEKLGVAHENIVCGAGVDSLLAYIIKTFTEKDDEVLTAEGTFIGIFVNTQKLDRRLKTTPLKDYAYDLKALETQITDKTKIIYIANPNNPTGTMLTRDELINFVGRVPEDRIIILDEAYHHFASEHSGYTNGLSFSFPNVIVTRTFSKDYGLAGLRIGYAVSHQELTKALLKVKLPFEPSAPGQAAALAALEDKDYVVKSLRLNKKSLDKIRSGLVRLEIRFVETKANFILMIFDSERIAARFCEECMNRGLILRHTDSFGIPEGVRISSGTDVEIEFALEILEEALNSMSQPATRRAETSRLA